jgi:hypothetical protein
MSLNDIPVNDFLLKSESPPDTSKDPLILANVVTATTLSELNLEDELLTQYKTARSLLELVKSDNQTPLNQKAQVMNTITTLLSNILRMQENLHNVERMKIIENVLIDTLKEHPKLRDKFLPAYEKALKEALK